MADRQKKQNAGIPVSDDEWNQAIPVSDDEWNSIFNAGPDATNIDASADAPPLIRMEVGALEKPEDRLAALRKTYPDAQPHGEDNFIFTDPETGKTRLYNQPNWNPFNLGDWASIGPQIGELVGGTVGAMGGAVTTAPTVLGVLPGTVAGAGLGAVAGKDAVRRGINWAFDNQDSRTQEELAKDKGVDFAMNAAGEGAGILIGKAVPKAWEAGKKFVVGANKPIDPTISSPELIQQRIEDMHALGIEPTPGMVTGADRQARLEHGLKNTIPGQKIEGRIKDAFTRQDNEWSRITNGMTADTAPMDRAAIGEALQKQAQAAKQAAEDRSNELYAEVGRQVTAPATLNNTTALLQKLADERARMGQFDAMTRGSQTDSVIEKAQAIVADAQNGMSFDKLKQARTVIGQLASDENDKVLKKHLDDLYGNLSKDMDETALVSSPDAKKAYDAASTHYRDVIKGPDGFGKGSTAEEIMKKDSDKVHDAIFGSAKDGGNKLAAVRRMMERVPGGKEEFERSTGSYIYNLGLKQGEEGPVFDPTRFFNSWNDPKKISPNAKKVMFGGTKNAEFQKDLDRLSRIHLNMKRYNSFDNHSNTGSNNTVLDTVNPFSKKNIFATALFSTVYMADPLAGAGAVAVRAGGKAVLKGLDRGYSAYQAKLLTSPETVKWLADAAKSDMQKGGTKAHLKKLRAMERNTSDFALSNAIRAFLVDLNYTDED